MKNPFFAFEISGSPSGTLTTPLFLNSRALLHIIFEAGVLYGAQAAARSLPESVSRGHLDSPGKTHEVDHGPARSVTSGFLNQLDRHYRTRRVDGPPVQADAVLGD